MQRVWARRSTASSPLDPSRSSANSRMVSSMPKRGSVGVPSTSSWTRLLSTSTVSRSSTSSTGRSAPLHTASAASSVQPPAKTARRRKRSCSADPSRSWLHSSVWRSVCWRSGRSGAPAVSNGSRCSRRRSSASGRSRPARAAASSMARRVLPTPPGPTSVSRRTAERAGSSRVRAAARSASRPMSGVGGDGSRTRAMGRLWATAAGGPGALGSAVEPLASSNSSPCSAGARDSAAASAATVLGYGRRRRSSSSAPMVATLTPARSARTSWVRPARSRSRRSCPPRTRMTRAARPAWARSLRPARPAAAPAPPRA